MEKWKLALKEFLKDYEEDDEVTAAILCGSYANDTYNEFSDIDVILLLKNDIAYEEKGIKEIQSYMIEYYKINAHTMKKYFRMNHENKRLTLITMMAYGKIIYDLNGDAKELQDAALNYIDEPLNITSNYDMTLNNYRIWDALDELKSLLSENSMSFNLVYYDLLDKVYDSYCDYLSLPKLPKSKLYKVLTDGDYRKKYHVFKLPEEEFISLYLRCYSETRKEDMYNNINNLIKYYYNKQGGFNIRKFSIRKE